MERRSSEVKRRARVWIRTTSEERKRERHLGIGCALSWLSLHQRGDVTWGFTPGLGYKEATLSSYGSQRNCLVDAPVAAGWTQKSETWLRNRASCDWIQRHFNHHAKPKVAGHPPMLSSWGQHTRGAPQSIGSVDHTIVLSHGASCNIRNLSSARGILLQPPRKPAAMYRSQCLKISVNPFHAVFHHPAVPKYAPTCFTICPYTPGERRDEHVLRLQKAIHRSRPAMLDLMS